MTAAQKPFTPAGSPPLGFHVQGHPDNSRSFGVATTARAYQTTATISNAAALSSAIETGGLSRWAVVLPASFLGANLTVQVSLDDATYYPLYDVQGQAVTVTGIGASQAFDLPDEVGKWPYFKLQSDTNQSALRTLLVVAKG